MRFDEWNSLGDDLAWQFVERNRTMADRYDVIAFRKTQGGKTYAVRCGSAQERNDGKGWNLWLDAIPAPVDGQFQLSVVPPRDRQSGDSEAPPF